MAFAALLSFLIFDVTQSSEISIALAISLERNIKGFIPNPVLILSLFFLKHILFLVDRLKIMSGFWQSDLVSVLMCVTSVT
jgi:hypothetical protein